MTTTTAEKSGQVALGDRSVSRLGYGAMQLAGPGVMGPPADRAEALAVLRRAVELGVDHIDTSDYYGPYVVNELIREALHPYPDELVLVTKVGPVARRTGTGRRRCPARSCARRSRTTSTTSGSTRWRWSTCGCRASPSRSSDRWPSRSKPSPRCSRRA